MASDKSIAGLDCGQHDFDFGIKTPKIARKVRFLQKALRLADGAITSISPGVILALRFTSLDTGLTGRPVPQTRAPIQRRNEKEQHRKHCRRHNNLRHGIHHFASADITTESVHDRSCIQVQLFERSSNAKYPSPQ